MKAVKKILFITLSNIGDVILTLPVLDELRGSFPEAKITVMVGERPKEIFEGNPYIEKVIVYNKHAKLREKFSLFKNLKKERFDIVVDLRSSLFGVLLPAFSRISLRNAPKNILHMKDRHLFKIRRLDYRLSTIDYRLSVERSLYISPRDEEYVNAILKENNIAGSDKMIVVAPGARSHIKRWPQERFRGLLSRSLEELKAKVILVGDKNDLPVAKYISSGFEGALLDLTGKLSLSQLASLLKRASCVVTNDSAVSHLASYLNAPVLAVFGPTDETKYGPWSNRSVVAKKDISCRPCQKAQCGIETIECMKLLKVEDVMRQVKSIVIASEAKQSQNRDCFTPCEVRNDSNDFKRILITRTDRIGDVLLSTPVVKALRNNFPNAYIAMMVTPYAKDIVEGNPYLDQVITYDKEGKHKQWHRTLKFSRNLKKKKFDLAIILHPANRIHLISFLAGIPRRVGYNLKCGFLLTDRIKHAKQLGEKHESEYALELLRSLDIESNDKDIFMPIKPDSEYWAEDYLRKAGLKETDNLLAIHPGASCPSRIWPADRYAKAAHVLGEKYGFKVLIISGPKDIKLAEAVLLGLSGQAVNLAGKTSVSQLASILKKCRLLISTDTGPSHIASAVGVPTLTIFGRSQVGLGPKRWRPLGNKAMVLQKEVGCVSCLAHNCQKNFACLKAVTVEDVLSAAGKILTS